MDEIFPPLLEENPYPEPVKHASISGEKSGEKPGEK